MHPEAGDIDRQRPYWEYTPRRLSSYANVLTWEIASEYVRNGEFQDAAGTYFQQNDPWGRPVCTSDGATDDAVWPHKPWMDLVRIGVLLDVAFLGGMRRDRRCGFPRARGGVPPADE